MTNLCINPFKGTCQILRDQSSDTLRHVRWFGKAAGTEIVSYNVMILQRSSYFMNVLNLLNINYETVARSTSMYHII